MVSDHAGVAASFPPAVLARRKLYSKDVPRLAARHWRPGEQRTFLEEVMDAKEILAQAHDVAAIKRVFGEPIEREGSTVVPVAAIWCFGLVVRPIGVYRIKGEEVEWQPAVDATMIALGGQLVGIVALLVLRSVLKRRLGRWGRRRGHRHQHRYHGRGGAHHRGDSGYI
jgi:hypothetical protein